MQNAIPTLGTISWGRRLVPARVAWALGLLLVFAFAQPASGQCPNPNPLCLSNNYFVTGDYVVGGVGLRGLGDATGFATGTIAIPDQTYGPATGVPPGADIVAAFLYWETVESNLPGAVTGQQGFFRGYPITGSILGNPNAPTSWSSGGCAGSSGGSKTMRLYRANVGPYLQVDGNGNVQPNTSYQVRLRDSGSNGAGVPFTLGATLVFIYRVLSPAFPLTSIVIYDGAFAPNNSGSTMSQPMQGFYQPAGTPVAKLTHIVGNGQPNKSEQVFFKGNPLTPANTAAFPGLYNGSWDNPTYSVGGFVNGSLPGFDTSVATSVVPSSSSGNCVDWGAVIFSTTVQNTDNDGLLDVWKINHGYCDASINPGSCTVGDPSTGWVDLPGAQPGTALVPHPDLFVEYDYMCSIVTNGVCDTTNGYSFRPLPGALATMASAFSLKGVTLHLLQGNAIQETTCTDNLITSPPKLCPYPDQAGVVGWKAGFEFFKNQPLNYPDETSCETLTPLNGLPGTGPTCIRRFQHGRKDSYHYALFAHAIGRPNWSLQGGSLASVVASGITVTFTTSIPHGLVAGDRVTVADAITNPSLNGTYFVQTPIDKTFTIQIVTAANATYTQSTDPQLSLSSGHLGTGSGFSDIGGADSLITLGLWGADGQTVPVQAGTFMHELGHSLGLTHGGFYYDQLTSTPPNYTPTVEANCKPNFQSVMSYLFQVDLLDNGVLDYSKQALSALNENNLPAGVTFGVSAPFYSTTKWYTPVQPGGIGTAATRHCDGTPLSPLTDINPTMYRAEGIANPITPAWSTPSSDINFDGIINAALRGHNDWTGTPISPGIDLRQIGATGSNIMGAAGNFGFGGGNFGFGGGNFGFGGGNFGFGGGNFGFGGGEINLQTANSVTRPPRNLTATALSGPRSIRLNWTVPTFGQIGAYNIYRGVDAVPVAPPYATVSGSPLPTPFTDTKVSCGHTYTYFVTAVLAGTNSSQESVPSTSVSVINCTK